MEQWNNVELSDLSKKSYTLNHSYDMSKKFPSSSSNDAEGAPGGGSERTPTTAATAAAPLGGAVEGGLLQPGSNIKPTVQQEDVESLLRRLYGITIGEMKELISYDDRNYYVQEDRNIKNPLIISHCPHGYVLKILNALDSRKADFVDAQNQLMIYLAKQGVQCPKPIANVNGKYYSVERLNGADHVVRLLEYIPGKIFHEVKMSNNLLYQSGEYIAKIDRALKNFQHEAYDTHKTLWMLKSVGQLRDFMYVLQDHARKQIVEEIIEAFEGEVLSRSEEFDTQIIHGDFNEQNIIVNQSTAKSEGNGIAAYKVSAIIDFGDTNRSPLIFEIGIAMTYMMLQAKSLESGGVFLAGYMSELPIKNEEKPYLKYCVAARLAQSLVMGAYTHSLDPQNEYVLVTQEQGWKLIELLWRENFDKIDEIWQTTGDKYLTQSFK